MNNEQDNEEQNNKLRLEVSQLKKDIQEKDKKIKEYTEKIERLEEEMISLKERFGLKRQATVDDLCDKIGSKDPQLLTAVKEKALNQKELWNKKNELTKRKHRSTSS